MSQNNNAAVTINGWFFGLLTLLFIGLKLTNYITWSWWWVLAPLWIPSAIVLIILMIAGTVIYLSNRKGR